VAYVVPGEPAGEGQEPGALRAELQAFLAARLPEYMVPHAWVLLDALPLTPNGKLDRRALPAPEHPQSEGAEHAAPRTPVEQTLAAIWAEVLHQPQVGIHDNFFALGGDSILSIQMVSSARAAGLALTPRQLFQHQTIAELALVVGEDSVVAGEQGLLDGDLPLTPIQHWFFELDLPNPHYFHQMLLFAPTIQLVPGLLEHALRELAAHHDALRLRFTREQDGWRQSYAPSPDQTLLHHYEIEADSQAARQQRVAAIAHDICTQINIGDGPVFQAALIHLGGDGDRLLLVAHHLAVDAVSWRILLGDLQSIYTQMSQGQSVALPAKSNSYRQWAAALQSYGARPSVQAERAYWLAQAQAEIAPLPLEGPGGANTLASADLVTVALDAEETGALLTQVHQAYGTQMNDILLASLLQAVSDWTGKPRVRLMLEGHGREEELIGRVDLTRTVGWFTTLYPLVLELPYDRSLDGVIKAVKEQVHQIPHHGLGYGVLRYLGAADPALSGMATPEISFNYLGQLDQMISNEAVFRLAPEPAGAGQPPDAPRAYQIEVEASVIAGQLQLSWIYSTHHHQRETIAKLAQTYLSALRKLIQHCLQPKVGSFTPSDFPQIQISQSELDDLIAELG